jgi:hypothetical protein
MVATEISEEADFDVISVATADEAIVVLEGGVDVHFVHRRPYAGIDR